VGGLLLKPLLDWRSQRKVLITRSRNCAVYKTIWTNAFLPPPYIKSLLKARRCDVAWSDDWCRTLSSCCYWNHGWTHEGGAVIVDVSIDTGGCFETSSNVSWKANLYQKQCSALLCYLSLVIQKQLHWVSVIFLLFFDANAEDGVLSAIRCEWG
jgi:alanine dehydrogenase